MPSELMTCECCPNQGENYKRHMTMIMCPECITKETALQLESAATADVRVNEVRDILPSPIERIQQIDHSIQIKSDIFNAQTVSIIELKKTIDEDSTIDNKNFKLAEILTDRVNHFKKVIFEMNEEMVNKSNEQRAVQVYLNNLSNSLRADEREKIKLADINYKPGAVKLTKPKPINLARKKFDKTELRNATVELNAYLLSINKELVPESFVQMVCIAKNMTPVQAANQIKSSFTQSQS